MLPNLVGRFVVLDRIGDGGTVVRAYDPELDRRVAVKLLAPELVHDARVLARLSHPNVVTIHEVGTSDGQTFIAMEYVQGVDLEQWMEANPAGGAARFAAAMRLLQDAGRGLAAAHTVGVVHRDVSPSRVLIRDDGQAKLTPASALVGSPGFRPPEHEGLDARGDQFSFCVMAWTLLFGITPWAGEPTDEPPRVPDDAPRWIVAVLTRGLSLDRAARHADMNALLLALARDPRRRRRLAAAVIGALAIVGTGAAVLAHHRATMCDDGPRALADTWNEPRRTALADHFASFEMPEADDVWQRADARMQSFVDEWLTTWDTACDAGRRRGVLAQETTDAVLECLQLRRVELEASVAVLQTADREVAAEATDVAYALRSPGHCAQHGYDAEALRLPADADRRAEVLRIWQELAAARLRTGVGDPMNAVAQLDALEPTLAALDYLPLQLRATDVRITAMLDLGRGDVTELAEDGYWTALRHGEDAIAAKLARRLASATLSRSDLPAARVWIDYARALGDRARVGDDALALLETVAARWSVDSGDLIAAKEHMDRALQHAESAWGLDHPDVTSIYTGLAIVHRRMHEFETAARFARKANEIDERTLGPTALGTTISLANLGAALSRLGRHEDALAAHRRVVAIRSAWLGDHDVEVASAFADLGATAWFADQELLAVDSFRRAVAIYRKHLPPESDRRLLAENNLAGTLRDAGDLDEALAIQTEVVLGFEQLYQGDHPRLATALWVLGTIQSQRHSYAEARVTLERSHVMFTNAYGERHPDTLSLRIALARLELTRGAPDVAAAAIARLLPDMTASEASGERGIALQLQGEALEQLGRRDDAATSFGEALALVRHPRARVEILQRTSALLRELGRTDAAAADARLGLREAQAIGDTAAIAAFTAALER